MKMPLELGLSQFFATFGAVSLAIFTAYYIWYYRMKGVLVRGITDTTRAIDGAKFRGALRKLNKKYLENKEVDEADLHKAAEQIRSDLIVVQGLIESNMMKKKRVYEIYSDIIVKAVNAYQKYLNEFYPDAFGLDIPIQRLYKVSQKWVDENKIIKSVKK